ncbi:PTS sugar transporter subunit IIB [Tepidanaerobacter sp. GT38]|uniref:PTS system mannose/fructose/N-acetylgalactosamine-transporter subunit IIB n=1 Tax=Tepidanaerobacter sp. GT38 TaxID=2722793 RepID=UPI001F1F5919|nr:PTS sugar transporter subunit IIB [Tepidanaerobacter sp. GT38]MCG1013402.1 PTS sugar transporter subunit IIB [Tepidanaerobacter sp. GT38]
MNVVLWRVDERLIHGQVMTSWLGYTSATKIVVVDDELYRDDFMKEVMLLAAPGTVDISIFDVNTFIENYNKSNDQSRTLVLFKEIKHVLELLDNGIDIKEVVIGNIGPKVDRNKITKNVYLSKQELDELQAISKRGCHVYLRMLPTNEKKELHELI